MAGFSGTKRRLLEALRDEKLKNRTLEIRWTGRKIQESFQGEIDSIFTLRVLVNKRFDPFLTRSQTYT